ncbi:MAG: sialidase family protein [Aureliella sp.]
MRLISTLFSVLAFQAITYPLQASEPVTIVSNDVIPHPRQPQVAVVDESTAYVTFGSNDTLFICKSSDGGLSFDSPTQVGSLEKLALGMRRGPRVVANDKFVVVSAISHESGDLSAWSSSDHGKTWSAPVVVNDTPKAVREGLHGMAIGPDGEVFCVWLDLRHGRTQIYGSNSSDGGRTWGENRQVYESPSGTVCECCHPSVAIDDEGAVHVMWRNVVEGNRDMYIAKSTDGSASFQSARKVGIGTWNLDACPMDGGDLDISLGGNAVTVWRRKDQIFITTDKSLKERSLGRGEQPEIAMGVNGEFIVWLSRRGGELKLLKPGSTLPETIATNAGDPVIATARSSPHHIIAAWEAGSKPNITIQTMVIAE